MVLLETHQRFKGCEIHQRFKDRVSFKVLTKVFYTQILFKCETKLLLVSSNIRVP